MKRTVVSLLICTVALSGLSSLSLANELKGESKSISDINFIQGGGENVIPTPDPNPDPNPTNRDPDPDPSVPENPTSGQKGPLRFTYLPDINFGNAELIPITQTYYSEYLMRDYTDSLTNETKKGKYPSFFTLEDVRGGAKGWTVSINHDGTFKNTDKDAKNKTINASIWMKNPNLVSGTFTSKEDLDKQAPGIVTGHGSENYFTISGNDDVTLLAAKTDQGYGKWSLGYGTTAVSGETTGYGIDGNQSIVGIKNPKINSDKAGKNTSIKLVVPAQVIDTDTPHYQAVLSWNISNVPGK